MKIEFAFLRLRSAVAVAALLSILLISFVQITQSAFSAETDTASPDARRLNSNECFKKLPSSVTAHLQKASGSVLVEIRPTDKSDIESACKLLASVESPIHIEVFPGVVLSVVECRAIAQIPALRDLDLEESEVSSKGLLEILECTGLRELSLPKDSTLSDAQGSITWPASLSILELNGCKMSDGCWASLSSASSLTCLYSTTENGAPELPQAAWKTIRALPRLTDLFVDIEGPDSAIFQEADTLKRLKTFGLKCDANGGMEMTKARATRLSEMARCKRLDLYGIHIGPGSLQEIGKMQSLKYLTIHSCAIHPDEHASFHHLQQVKRLQLSFTDSTEVTTQSIGRISGLKSLELNACFQIGDEAIEHLLTLQELEHLGVIHTRVGDPGFKLLATLPRLRSLNAQSALVTDRGVEALAREGRLRRLSLRGTEVTQKGIQHLSKLSDLVTLNVGGIRIDSAAANSLSKIRSLENLFLQDCGLNDDALQQILLLPKLKYIELSKNPLLTEHAGSQLVKHPSLRKLLIDDDRWSSKTNQLLSSKYIVRESSVMKLELVTNSGGDTDSAAKASLKR